MLRLPDGMRDRIKAEAEKGGRSMNAEIILRLQRSIEGDQLGFSGDLLDVLSLHAMLTSSFAKMLDRSKLSQKENDMLDLLEGAADRVVSSTYFKKSGPFRVGVTEKGDAQ